MHHMIGGGISALSAAAYLMRDAGVRGADIRIYDDHNLPGGALDGVGEPREGYITRGGRMFEPNFVNTFDLFGGIPAPDNPEVSVTEDIMAFNAQVRAASNCRLIADGAKADMAHLGLQAADILSLNRLILTPETLVGDSTIGFWFDRTFFDSNFWIMWSTMFSFQPWHSAVEMRRYMRRFLHLFPGLTRISGVLRTRYNQYDSLIAPLTKWLVNRGVTLLTDTSVKKLVISGDDRGRRVDSIRFDDGTSEILGDNDKVYITIGSMVDGATYGTNRTVPDPHPAPAPSWQLWYDLANEHDGFGRPEVFCRNQERTTWTSFTVTMERPEFRNHIEALTGNATGTGGLVTIRDSAWLLSFVLFHQPHFRSQPQETTVFWGYGLRGDRTGNHVDKPMWQCTGDEIMSELGHHLGLTDGRMSWFDGARVRLCRMPFITSQFMPRKHGDRPRTTPKGAQNFALMGQFVELPTDAAFTVEYSIRSARTAVKALTGVGGPLPVVRKDRDPATLMRAARTLLRQQD